jgi:hypothetical protein
MGGTTGGTGGRGGSGGVSSGGTLNTGGTLSMGGTTGGGGTVDPCTQTWNNYKTQFELARACTIGQAGECSGDFTLKDECGCPIPVNGPNANYTKALELYNKWSSSCLPLCLVGCIGADTNPTCKASSGSTTMGKCSW